MYQKILVPLDGSELAEKALPYAREIAHRFDAELILLVVVTLPRAVAVGPEMHVPLGWSTLKDYENEQAELFLEEKKQELEEAGQRVQTVLRGGAAEDGIVDYAEDEDVDLVVMSSHGRSGLSRWIFGSVTQKVLQGCAVPVLVVKPEKRG